MTKYLDHKPCPKCGDDELDVYRLEGHDGIKGYWIKCNKCGYELEGMCGSREEAWKVWNEIDRKDNKFKPCFICGGEVVYGKLEVNGKYWVKCKECGNYIELDAPALEDAIKEWNDIELIENELEVNKCSKCGGELIDLIKWRGYHVVKCRRCGYYGGWLGASKASAIKEWNEVNKEEDFKDCEVVKESKHYRYSIKAEKLFDGSFYKRLKITDLRGSMIYEIVIDRNDMLVLAELIREIDDMPDNVFRCECGCPVLKVKKVFVGEYSNYTVECSNCGKEYFIDGKYKWMGNVFVKREGNNEFSKMS